MTPLGLEHWQVTDERKVNGRVQITARYTLDAACCTRCGAVRRVFGLSYRHISNPLAGRIAFPGVLHKHGRLGTIYNDTPWYGMPGRASDSFAQGPDLPRGRKRANHATS